MKNIQSGREKLLLDTKIKMGELLFLLLLLLFFF
jgi:hypothetical protein